MNGLITIETFEHSVDGVVVSHRVIKLFGLPLFIRHTESSNYNWVAQFDPNNFVKPEEEKKDIPLYTETHIGFSNEETTKENNPQTNQQDCHNKASI